MGSDYYNSNEEDPLLASGSKGFKKKSVGAGQKRSRLNALALADHDTQDIVSALEQHAGQTDHLQTKRARQDAIAKQTEKQAAEQTQKQANF